MTTGQKKAEIGVMWSQVSEDQQPLEAGRGKEWILSQSLQKGHIPANTLILAYEPDFRHLTSRTMRK